MLCPKISSHWSAVDREQTSGEGTYGAPVGRAPGTKEEPPRPVWDRTEEGRKEMESLGEILAQRVIGQEAAVVNLRPTFVESF